MAGHYRVAVSDARMGQPEVNLGIIPGAEGTQRLTRLVGVEKAIEMCVSGKPIGADEAKRAGLIDQVIEGDLTMGAVAFAREAVRRGTSHPRTRDRVDKLGTAASNAPLFVRPRDGARRAASKGATGGHRGDRSGSDASVRRGAAASARSLSACGQAGRYTRCAERNVAKCPLRKTRG